MATTHLSIADANKDFLEMERRHNYTTLHSAAAVMEKYKNT
jgi:hypothetical protein